MKEMKNQECTSLASSMRMIMKRAVVILVVLVSSILLLQTMTGTRQHSTENIPLRLEGTKLKALTPPTIIKAITKTKPHYPVPKTTTTTTTTTTATTQSTTTMLKSPTASKKLSWIHNIVKTHFRQTTHSNYTKGITKHQQYIIHPGLTNTPKQTIILILAYLRSGSTFTASLFSHVPGAFFVFEPLHMLHKLAEEEQQIVYLNWTIRSFPDGKVSQDQLRVSLESWMGCRFNQIDKESLLDEFHAIYSTNSTQSFLFCVQHRRIRNHPTLHAIKDCLPRLEFRCNMAYIRAFKTIRLAMKSTEFLLENYPNLKVIHLVRDPRGMFLSQMLERLINVNLRDYIKRYCRRIANDLEVSKRLSKLYRNNLMLVRYEDLAVDPLNEAKKLYKFTGVDFTDELKTYVNQSTSQNLRDDCNYCTTRSNSSRTAFKWRDKITSLLLNLVNQHCGGVMSELGYIRISNLSHIRDQALPSIADINFD